LVVWLGIKVAFILRRTRKSETKTISEYVLMSEEINRNLELKLQQKIKLSHQLITVKNNAEIIFDANVMSYQEIINHIKKSNNHLTYKILPNESNFIVGSNNGFSQGEVIVFE